MGDADGRGWEVLDRIHDGLFELDLDWRFTVINRAAERFLGRPREELLGRSLWDEYPALRGTEVEAVYRKAFATQEPCELELLSPVFKRWVEVRVFPSPGGLSVHFMDVTRRKQSEAALRVLADASARLQSSLDLDTVLSNLIELVVPAFADLAVIDVIAAEHIRRVAATRTPGGDPRIDVLIANAPDDTAERGVARVLRTREPELIPVVCEEWLRAATRGEAHLAAARALGTKSVLMVPLIARDAILGVLSLVHLDYSRRFSEDDLPLARGLADRAALAIDNARLYQEAIEARRRRDEMLAVVSHDLRTPLNTIALWTQLLARRHPGGDFTAVKQGLAQADRLVQDLLTVAAVDSGKLPLHCRDEDLGGMLAEVIDIHRPLADQRDVTLTLECVDDVGCAHVDRHRFEQAMANLVGNALKFTPPGGRVRVCATREPGARVVEISDSGVGIPKEELPRLFDRFWRGQHEHAGVGLGLAIAKGVIDGHGGQLAVSSEPGAGTTVTIRLPEATAEPTLTLPEPALAAVMHR